MLDSDVVVTRQMEDAKFNPDGTSTAIIRVEYMVGKHGPFVERFVKADYTAFVRDDRLNACAREYRTP